MPGPEFPSPGGDGPIVPGGPSLHVSRKAQGAGGVPTAGLHCPTPTSGHQNASVTREGVSFRAAGTSMGQSLRSPGSSQDALGLGRKPVLPGGDGPGLSGLCSRLGAGQEGGASLSSSPGAPVPWGPSVKRMEPSGLVSICSGRMGRGVSEVGPPPWDCPVTDLHPVPPTHTHHSPPRVASPSTSLVHTQASQAQSRDAFVIWR